MFKLPVRCQMQSGDYEAWVSALADKSVVAVQQFDPPGDVLNPTFNLYESWVYTKAVLRYELGCWIAEWPGGAGRFRADGRGIKFGADRTEDNPIDEWGSVFPARLVPIADHLSRAFECDRCLAVFDKPIYESLFTGQQRLRYLLPTVKRNLATQRRNRVAASVRHYSHEVNEGLLLVAFEGEPLDVSTQLGYGWQYLYSEQL